MMSYMDSGAQADIVGRNWVANLELHGGVVEPLPAAMRGEWLDPKIFIDVHDMVKMEVGIAGTAIRLNVNFLIAPWDLDYVVIGWKTMTKNNILRPLEDLIAMQCSLGLSTGVGMSCDEQEICDMDGEVIKTDNLIFCDETTAAVKVPESALTESQSVVVEELLCKYAEVFEEKPAGSARVEPMVVKMKEGWSPPPMEPYRNYPPRVEEAIKKDMDKQHRTGVVEESDADKGCPVHMVPKQDSESGYRFCVDFRARNVGILTHYRRWRLY